MSYHKSLPHDLIISSFFSQENETWWKVIKCRQLRRSIKPNILYSYRLALTCTPSTTTTPFPLSIIEAMSPCWCNYQICSYDLSPKSRPLCNHMTNYKKFRWWSRVYKTTIHFLTFIQDFSCAAYIPFGVDILHWFHSIKWH